MLYADRLYEDILKLIVALAIYNTIVWKKKSKIIRSEGK